jgi:hypothetical protein
METPNIPSLGNWWKRLGATDDQLMRVYRSFNASKEPFRTAGDVHEQH